MNYTTRITDWTCDRSDRRRAARRDVRFYHRGAPTQTKQVYFITLTTLFQKKNIKFKVALRPFGPEADGHFGFKSWSPSREIRHAELDVTPDMMTSADSSRVHKRKSRPTLVIQKNRTVARSWFNVHPPCVQRFHSEEILNESAEIFSKNIKQI